MEYESRQVKWYWLLVFILFCCGTVYLLFSGNPYLYSHLELRSALNVNETTGRQTVPSHPQVPAKLGTPTYFSRYNQQRSATDPGSAPRSRAYIEHEHHVVDLGENAFEIANFVGDDSGFYFTGKSPWVVAAGFDGSIRWKYRFLDLGPDRSLLPVLLDDQSAYLIHPAGRLVCLDKVTGQIRWVMDLHQDVVANPFFFQKNILVPVKGTTTNNVQLVHVHRADGKAESALSRLDAKPGFNQSYSHALSAFVFTADNKVTAIDPEDWSVLWSQTLTDPVKGPAVVVENGVYVATLGAKIIRLDSSKKGKIDWETDLEKPAASPPAYLPIMQKLSVLDTSGALLSIDAKTGKIAWRYGVENRNPLVETWSSRLKGNNIEEFKMDWLHKGWTIWSPCSDRRFCIYTPGKGQLIQRVQLSGVPLSLPVLMDKKIVFLTQPKPGQYAVSVAIEEGEIKRLKAEAAAAEGSEK